MHKLSNTEVISWYNMVSERLRFGPPLKRLVYIEMHKNVLNFLTYRGSTKPSISELYFDLN